MKLTSFTREKTRTGNFSFLEFGKGKAYMLSLLMLSLVLFSSNTAMAGGFFEKMFKKAEKVMVVKSLADHGVISMSPLAIGVISITDVAACDDGAGNVTFSVTFAGFTPPLDPPYQFIISYMSTIGRQNLTTPGVTPGSPTPTVMFGPVNNAMDGVIRMEQISNNSGGVEILSQPAPPAGFAYTIALTPSGVDAGAYGPLCVNDAAITLTGTSMPAAGAGVTGTWSGTGVTDADNMDNTASFDPAVAGVGTHTLTYTVDNGGCIASDDVDVVVNPLPTPSVVITDMSGIANDDGSICVGEDATLTASGGTSYQFYLDADMSGDFNAGDTDLGTTNPLTATGGSADFPAGTTVTVSVDVTDANGCTATTTADVTTYDDVPAITSNPVSPVTFCEDEMMNSDMRFTLSPADAVPSYTYTYTYISGPASIASFSTNDGGNAGSNSRIIANNGIAVGTHVVEAEMTVAATGCTGTIQLTFVVDPLPTVANAGPDQQVCADNVVLAANAVGAMETGTWSEVAGDGNGAFADANDPTTTFTGTRGVTYTLRWTISNAGVCADATDDVDITLDEDPTTANAGADQDVCGTMTFLAANTPTVGTGSWSIISGAGGMLSNSSDPTSTFTGMLEETYTLRWTISNGVCPPSTDDVIITLFDNPTAANAGADQQVCADNTTLAANTAGGFMETGTWTIVAGDGNGYFEGVPGTLTSNDPAASFNGTRGQVYTLRWTISNGVCPSSSDDVQITLDEDPTTANAGADQDVCGNMTFLAANTPTVGNGVWSIISGAGGMLMNSSDPTSQFNGTLGETYTLRWTISNGVCPASTDDVTITLFDNPTAAAAGMDQAQCGSGDFILNGNTPVVGTGMWSVISGTATIVSPASPNSGVTGVPVGTSATLRWTISNGPCPVSTDDVVLEHNPIPTVDLQGATIVCRPLGGTNMYEYAGNPMGGTPPFTHSWSENGNFAVNVTNNNDGTATLNIGLLASGSFTLTYTVTDSKGCMATDMIDIVVPATCTPEPTISDPCECIDDADVNADNGTFREVVTIIGPNNAALPAGQTWTVRTVNGAYLPDLTTASGPQGGAMPVGQVLQYCNVPGGCNLDGDAEIEVPQGGYYLYLEHVDNEGYNVEIEGPLAFGNPANLVLSEENTCFYPEPQILNLPSMVCNDDAPLLLQGSPVITGVGSFAGDATYIGGAPAYTYAVLPAGFLTDNLDGTATINPAAATPGCYKVSYTFNDNGNPGTDEPGCVQVIEADVFVAPVDDPTFAVAGGPFCPDDVNPIVVPLNLTTALSVWPACAAAPAPTDDERVNWYGGDGVNVIVTDNADASGTVTIAANAASGVYTICTEAGVGACQSNYCINIAVNPNLTPASAALIADQAVCLEPTEVFSLNALLAPGTIHGGTWSVVAGPTGSLVGNLQGSGVQYFSGDGTLTLQYEVTDCDANTESDQIVLTIDEKPTGSFTLPANLCQDGGVVNPTLTGVPTGATVSFSSSPVGFVTNALTGAFDPAAGPLSGECVNVLVTMTVTNDNACAAFPYTVSQHVTVCASGNPAWSAASLAISPVCVSAGIQNLTLLTNLNDQGVNNLLPANVFWSGEGVADTGLGGTFNPAAAGVGVHNVCVTVGAPGCEETECHDIVVQPDYVAADVALTADFDLCLFKDDIIDFYSLLTPNANPAGQFLLTGVTGTVFGQVNGSGYEYNGGCGTITVQYSFADDCDGPTTDAVTITISERNDVGDISDPGPLCVTDGPANLFYSGFPFACTAGPPVPGVFLAPASPPGSLIDLGNGAGAIFNPAIAGEGEHLIQYLQIDPQNICQPIVIVKTITVRAAGDQTFTIPNEVCLGDVQAAGGIVLQLNAPINASLDEDDEVEWYGGLTGDVSDDYAVTASLIDGLFIPSQAGTYTICVDFGDTDCTQTYCEDIIVHDNANATLAFTEAVLACTEPNGFGNIYFDLSTLYIPGVTTPHGTWSVVSQTGVSQILNETIFAEPGNCMVLRYTVVTDPTAVVPSNCIASSDVTLLFQEEPQPGFDLAEEVCWDGTAGSIVLPTLYNGDQPGNPLLSTPQYAWVANLVSGAGPVPTFNDATIQEPTVTVQGAGVFEICLTESRDYAACGLLPLQDDVCGQTICHTLTIHETNVEVIAAWTLPDPQCTSGAAIDLDALVTGNADGVFTGEGVELDLAHPDYRFNPAAVVIPAGQDWVEVSVCYTVGNGAGCDATECHTIRVYDDVDATLQDITQCMDANTQIDLTELFVTGTTDTYGTFVLNGQSANAPAATVTGDVLSFAQPALNIGDFWYDIEYTVGFNPPNGDCQASDIGRVNIDNDGPTNTFCPPSQIVDNDPDKCGAVVNYAIPLFADECDGTDLEGYIVEGLPTGNYFNMGVTTVRWHYTDEDGNGPVECAFLITVNDTEAPHALCQDQITVILAGLGSNDPAGNAFVTAAMVDAGSWDNCIGTEEYKVAWVSGLPDPNDPSDWKAQEGTTCVDVNSTQVIAMRVVDLEGNVDTCHTNVAIKDYEAPDVECPGNIYVETDPGVCTAVVNYAATISDNCMAVAEQTALFGGPVNGAQENPPVATPATGIVSGDIGIVNGNLNMFVNVSGLTGTITAAHIHAGAPGSNGPVIFDLVAESDFPIGGTSVVWNGKIQGNHPTMVGNNVLAEILAGNAYVNIHTTTSPSGEVRGQLNILYNSNIPSGGTFPLGTTVIAFEGYETQTPYLLANTDKCQFTVTVVDAEMPVLACDPTLRVRDNAAGLCSYTGILDEFDVTATDNCTVDSLYHDYTVSAGHAVSSTTLAGATFPVGITDVIWTAIDDQGNKATCTVQIEINDVEDPTITNVPADVTVDCGSEIPAVVYPNINDNCLAIVDFSEIIVTDSSTDEQILVRTWNVIDPSGNTNSASQTITINDNIDPVASNIPADVTVDCGSDIPAVAPPTFVDNCSEFTVDFSEVIVTDSSTDEQVLVRTWVATDAAGNSTTVTQTITINDNVAPVASNVPSDVTVDCGSDIPAVAAPTFVDNCDEFTVDFSEVIVTDSSTDEQELLRTWVATDAAGNSTTVTQTITINDNVAPVASNVPTDVTVDCGSDIPAVAAPTFVDNCDEFTVDFSEVIVTDSSTDEQELLRTWVATDAAGNSTTVTQTITINDNINPTITNVPQDITVSCASDIPAVVHPDIADNCDEVFVDFSETLVDEFSTDEQVIHRTWVATDAAGNQSTATQVITVLDVTPPMIVSQPSSVTVSCGSDIPPVIPPFFTDNCGEFTVDFSEVILTDSSTDEQLIRRSWRATDEAGNSITVIQNITINDNVAPVASNVPADVTVDCGSDIPAVAAPTFTDNCDEFIVDFSEVIVTDSSTDEQILVRTWVATDEAGNSTTVSQTITINDDTAPVIANVPADVTVNCGDEIPAVVSPDITDNCDEVFVDFSETISQINFGNGIIVTRTWVATDAAGNQTTAVQVVTVDDTVDPVITCSTAPTSFGTDPGECSYKVTDTSLDPTASDNCDVYTITHNYAMAPQSNSLNGAQFPVGQTQVGFTVTDAAGNTAECSITIDVTDTEAPTFVNCPTTMVMVGNDVDVCSGKLNWSIPVATDNCEIQLVAQTGGPAPGTAVPVGTSMTVTYTATDIYGNASTCMFDVQVVDTQKPQFDADIVMPGNVTVQCDNIPAPFVLTNDDVFDNCTPSANLIINFTETSTKGNNPNACGFYNYTITRTWTITDQAGNVRTHIQIITVQDTTPPVPTCTDQVVVLDLFGNGSINPIDVIAGTTDNCAGFANLTVTASQTNFDCSDVGLNTVTLTIMDPCGNTATCVITVDVQEGAAPCTPIYDPLGSDPCICLDNATTLTNGQFGEVLQIQSLAGQTWTVQSSTGLYTTTSPAPPAAPTPLPNGTVLTVTGNGTFYRLDARHVDAIGFTVTLVNNVGQTFTFANTCHYPTPVVDLPLEICLGTDPFIPVVTDQFAGAGAYNSISFMVDGVNVTQVDPSTLSIGQHTLKVTVDAGDAAPKRFVNGVMIDAGDPRLDPGCVQSRTVFFFVVTTPSQVVCNDNVHLTIEPDCTSEVLPDQVLEGSYACFDDYTVHLFTPNNIPLNPTNVVTSAQIGQTLVYHLVHPISGNVCWGYLTVEDKNAPVITCPPNVEVLCTVDPDSVVYFMSTPLGQPYFARDYFGNLVPSGTCDSLLYFGHPTATDCSPLLPLDCGGRTWTYNDDYTTYECAQNPAVIADIVRTFVVEDKWGNYGTCQQLLTWKRGEADQVDWPADYHIDCDDPFLADLIASGYDSYHTGRPSIYDLAAAPTLNKDRVGTLLNRYLGELNLVDNGICELGLTMSDQLVNVCAKEYKVVRTWTLYDWCPEPGNPSITVHVQNIKVINVDPVITVTCDYYTSSGICVLNATEPGNLPHYACAAIYVPFADIDAGCDALVEVSVETPLGNTGNGGVLPSPGLPIGGPYTITYRAEDQCGNITQLDVQVMVEDRTAPIAICDEITDVNIGVLGQATVYAETFDDGSYDGCALDKFQVRRMNSTCGSTSFGPTITFNCCDVANSPVMVVFRAVDYAGNTNDCMVQVHVNDKTPPLLISCPANERVSCDWYAEFLETQLANVGADEQCDILANYFGNAVYQDNCDPDVDCTVSFNLDQCLDGSIRRTWIARDDSGNTNSSQNCNQTIFVDHVSDFVVEFPQHRNGASGHLPPVECGSDVPDFGEPEIFYETCELVAVSYEDEIFTDVVDACYKIVRQWTVINWCVVGSQIDQEVTEDSELAMRLAGCLSIVNLECDLDGDGDCDDRTFRDSWAICNLPDAAHANQSTNPDTDPDSDPWDGFITYQQVIKVNDTVDPIFTDGCDIPDICINGNTCVASFTLPTPDIDECSSFVTFSVSGDLGNGFGPFTNVAPGEYDVRYVAMDNCNNQTACETVLTVVDCKKPTPYCKNGIVVELMVVDPAMVEVWASDLDANSFDNCPGTLTFSFSANTTDIGRVFTCDHVDSLQQVEIWVTDAAGNQDFCVTVIDIQANMDQCDDDPSVVNVGGAIQTEENEGVEDVNVQLSGAGQMSVMTDISGSFSFPVSLGGDYTVTPSKDDNHLNGVTTYDLVKITKHILGVSLLDSPYKLIAADANKSNTVTTFDLVQIRKLILYINDKFPSNTSWRFVDKDFVFPNSLNPWQTIFPEVTNYNNVAQSILDADFVAVKIGDVNGSATTSFTDAGEDRTMVGSLVFNVEDKRLEKGETYTVDFKATDFNYEGYQFTLNFDQSKVEFVDVVPAIANAENFGLSLLEEGVITASWNDNNVNLAGDQVIFSLQFRANQNVNLSNAIAVNSRYTVAEAYNTNGELLDVELAFNGATAASVFELYQNTPNPFSKQTVIGFTLPEASAVKLTITDVSGKVVKVLNGDFQRGYNEFKLERRDLTSTGIMYYQLDTDTDSATKMMILVD